MRRILYFLVIISFIASSVVAPGRAYASSTVLGLPMPGAMVSLSSAYEPLLIKGLKVHPDNPLALDFILDTGDSRLTVKDQRLRTESQKLIKYFFAALTLPEQDVWVNLSPYEKNRIVPEATGQTEMGRDMLAQDYILKQITASLIYPEKGLGKDFWDRVYKESYAHFGTTQIPVNTFNKVWIVADKASVYENGDMVLVVNAHLKVMLEEDYLALQKHVSLREVLPNAAEGDAAIPKRTTHSIASQVIRQIILPALEKEVNTGKNFANLRQIFYSIILAKWYKDSLKTALLNQVYSDKDKLAGVDVVDKKIKEKIYQQYLQAYKKGVFNYIKEDTNQETQQTIPRKYFSGGMKLEPGMIGKATASQAMASWDWSDFRRQIFEADVSVIPETSQPPSEPEIDIDAKTDLVLPIKEFLKYASKFQGRKIDIKGDGYSLRKVTYLKRVGENLYYDEDTKNSQDSKDSEESWTSFINQDTVNTIIVHPNAAMISGDHEFFGTMAQIDRSVTKEETLRELVRQFSHSTTFTEVGGNPEKLTFFFIIADRLQADDLMVLLKSYPEIKFTPEFASKTSFSFDLQPLNKQGISDLWTVLKVFDANPGPLRRPDSSEPPENSAMKSLEVGGNRQTLVSKIEGPLTKEKILKELVKQFTRPKTLKKLEDNLENLTFSFTITHHQADYLTSILKFYPEINYETNGSEETRFFSFNLGVLDIASIDKLWIVLKDFDENSAPVHVERGDIDSNQVRFGAFHKAGKPVEIFSSDLLEFQKESQEFPIQLTLSTGVGVNDQMVEIYETRIVIPEGIQEDEKKETDIPIVLNQELKLNLDNVGFTILVEKEKPKNAGPQLYVSLTVSAINSDHLNITSNTDFYQFREDAPLKKEVVYPPGVSPSSAMVSEEAIQRALDIAVKKLPTRNRPKGKSIIEMAIKEEMTLLTADTELTKLLPSENRSDEFEAQKIIDGTELMISDGINEKSFNDFVLFPEAIGNLGKSFRNFEGNAFSDAEISHIADHAFMLWEARMDEYLRISANKEKLPEGMNLGPYTAGAINRVLSTLQNLYTQEDSKDAVRSFIDSPLDGESLLKIPHDQYRVLFNNNLIAEYKEGDKVIEIKVPDIVKAAVGRFAQYAFVQETDNRGLKNSAQITNNAAVAAVNRLNLNPGGIDLNASRINMQRSGPGAQIQFNQAMIAQFRRGDFSGITPVITGIKQISSAELF